MAAGHPSTPAHGGALNRLYRPIGKKGLVADAVAPTPDTKSPANGATDVGADANVVITFSEAIRNINNSVLTNTNIDSLITFKEDNSSGSNIAFDATIDSEKKVITINPDSDFGSEQVVYVAMGATVEDGSDNAIDAFSFTFTSEFVFTPTYSNIAFNVYFTVNSDVSQLGGLGGPAIPTSNYEIQVFEVNTGAANNWVRTVFDHVGTLSGGLQGTQFEMSEPGTLALTFSAAGIGTNTASMSLSSLSSTYYVMRASFDDSNDYWGDAALTFLVDSPSDGEGYNISQASAYSDFEGTSTPPETDAQTHPGVTLGSGFPTARYDTLFDATSIQFRSNMFTSTSGKPLWMWIAAG